MYGGGGRALPAKLGIEDIACPLSSRTSFGICPSTPVARNVGQTLNQSCSPREKRHREKRGFRLVPLLARAVQGDKNMQCDRKNELSSRGANERERHGVPATEWHLRQVGHDFLTPNQLGSRLDRRWIATLPVVARNDVGRLARLAFTMAEILLSLTIIGVVAAITLPSLTGNINERTWNTQRKALYARFSQAIALMPSLNQYSDVDTFLASGLAKVLKINNICDKDHLTDCGITSAKITDATGNQLFMPKK